MNEQAVAENRFLQQVVWACHDYWQGEPTPEDQRTICYSWVLDTYRSRFGERFHQSNLHRLASLGFLHPEGTSRGGKRRYYALCNPGRIAELLADWGLLGQHG